MGITERLEDLRAQFPECRVAAFADLDARTVLTFSAAEKPQQEHLDALCAAANSLLNGELATRLNLSGKSGRTTDEAVALEGGQMTVVVRLPDAPGEALCCLCAPEIDLGAFSARARSALSSGEFRQ